MALNVAICYASQWEVARSHASKEPVLDESLPGGTLVSGINGAEVYVTVL
jgi:hypothetical protein